MWAGSKQYVETQLDRDSSLEDTQPVTPPGQPPDAGVQLDANSSTPQGELEMYNSLGNDPPGEETALDAAAGATVQAIISLRAATQSL